MRKANLMACIILCIFSLTGRADVQETWTGDVDIFGKYFSDPTSIAPYGQTFTIPEGKIGTQFEFYVNKGTTTQDYVIVAVYDMSNNLIELTSTSRSAALWEDGYAWVPASSSSLHLAPGTYYAVTWSNEPDANSDLCLYRSTTSTYEGGYAFNYWSPGTPLGDNQDFKARVTMEFSTVMPEKAHIGWYDDRWGFDDDADLDNLCGQKASQIASEGASVVLPYLGGVNWNNYDKHIINTRYFGMEMMFEFNDAEVKNGLTTAITGNVTSFDPYVLGWYIADEPSQHGYTPSMTATAYAAIKQNSNKPVFIAFNNTDLNQQAPISYATGYDVMMVDVYPFGNGVSLFENLEGWKSVVTMTKSQAESVDKPWWMILPAFGTTQDYPISLTHRLPTYTEERFMTYWSVLQGATGILFWSHTPCLYSVAQPGTPYPYDGAQWIDDVAKPIMKEFNTFAVAIQAGPLAGAVTASNTDMGCAVYRDNATNEYFLIAANGTIGSKTVQFTLTLPPEITKAFALSENRQLINLTGGSFSDTFAAYQVHVYRLISNPLVINTWSGANETDWSGLAVQWFTVPAEMTGTKFEFYAKTDGVYQQGWYVNVQVFDSNNNHMGTRSMDSTAFNGEIGGWVAVENLALAPGKYYAQMYTNDADFRPYLKAVITDSSAYLGGYAATGWDGGAPTGDGQDFEARLSVVANVPPVPGDANGDHMVDVGDLGILAANYGRNLRLQGVPASQWWSLGDFNNDGIVDVGDLGILAANYGSNFSGDYAKVFDTGVMEDEAVEDNSSLCNALGLPLVAGLLLMGLMLVKWED